MILMPAMGPAQQAAWHSLLDLYELQPDGWTLIGGQLVHLLCAERGYSPQRPTSDADAVVNARVPEILGAVTSALPGYTAQPQTIPSWAANCAGVRPSALLMSHGPNGGVMCLSE